MSERRELLDALHARRVECSNHMMTIQAEINDLTVVRHYWECERQIIDDTIESLATLDKERKT